MAPVGRLVVIAVLASGCGRYAFEVSDASSCALGHDEDGDAVDDGCDVCPHISDLDQSDQDGDGVGDACDPSNEIAHEWVRFDPFVTFDTAVWRDFGVVTPGADSVIINGIAAIAGIALDIVDGPVVIEFAGRALQRDSTPAQIAIHLLESPMLGCYAELYDPGTHYLKLTLIDNGTYTSFSQTPIGAPLEPAELSLRVARDGQLFDARGVWAGTEHAVGGPCPLPIALTSFNVSAGRVELEVDYIAIIAPR